MVIGAILAAGCFHPEISYGVTTQYWDVNQNAASPGFSTANTSGAWDDPTSGSGYWTTDSTGLLGNNGNGDIAGWLNYANILSPASDNFNFNSGALTTTNNVSIIDTVSPRTLSLLNGRWTLSGGTIFLGPGGLNVGVTGNVGSTTNISNTISSSIVVGTNGAVQTWTNSSSVATNNTSIAGEVDGTATVGGVQTLTLSGTAVTGSGFTLSGFFTDGVGGGQLGLSFKSAVPIPTTAAVAPVMQANGFNTYTGPTQITNGALQVSNLADQGQSSALGQPTGAQSAINLGLANSTNSTALIYNASSSSSTNRVINLAGAISTATLANYSTDPTVTVSYTGGVTAAAKNKTLLLNGTNLGNNSIEGVIQNPTDGVSTLALTKSGVGQWVLGANNTYSGGTTITAGTLSLEAGGTLGANVSSNKVTIQGGNLLLSAPTNVGSNQSVIVTSVGGGVGVSYDPQLSTDFPAITDNSGTVGGVFGINYTGDGGIGRIPNINALFSATSAWSLGSFTGGIPGVYTGTSLPTGNGSAYRIGGGGGDLTIQNNIFTGANNLILGVAQGGSGTMHLSDANDFTGTTSIQNGTVTISSLKNVGGGPSSLGAPTTVANGTIGLGTGANAATLVYTGAGDTTDRVLNFTGTTGVITLANSGSGSLAFTSAPTFTGAGAKTLTLGGATDFLGGSIGKISDSIAGGKTSLTKAGAGTWILSGTGANTNTYTGDTLIAGGVLQTATAADLSTSYVKLTNGSNPQAVVGAPIWQTNGTITRTISNTSAPGNLSWNPFSGFAAQGGKLTLNFGSTPLVWGTTAGFMGSGGATMIFGSSTADSQVELTANINLNSNDRFLRPIYVNQGVGGDSALLSGVLTGNGSAGGATGINKEGPGTLILSGLNTYTGETVITDGTLVAGANVPAAGSAGAFGSAAGAPGATTPIPPLPNISLGTGNGTSSPSLMIGGAFTVARPVVVSAATTTGLYSIGGSTDNNATFSGAIAANQNLSIRQVATTNNNTLLVSGAISGPVVAGPGVVVNFDNVGAVSSTGVIADGVVPANPVTMAPSSTVPVGLSKTNAGVATISAPNTYSGGTTVYGGSLVAGSNGAFGVGNVVVLSSAISLTLQLGVTNAINDQAFLSLSGGGAPGVADAGFLNLQGSDTVLTLFLGGAEQQAGTYGSSVSGAEFTNDEYFSGPGILTVTSSVPEPTTSALLITTVIGLGTVVFRRRGRR